MARARAISPAASSRRFGRRANRSAPRGGRAVFVVHAGTVKALLSELAVPKMGYFDVYTEPGGAWAATWDGRCLRDVRPASGRCPVMTILPSSPGSRPTLPSATRAGFPSRRRHGARDYVGRRPPAGRIPRKRPRARAPQGLRSPWRFRLRVGFDLGNPASLRHGSLRLALRGRGMGELIRFSRHASCAARARPWPARSRRAALSRRAKPSGASWDATRLFSTSRASRAPPWKRWRRTQRRRHRAAFLPYDRGCALGHGVQGGEHARQHGGLQKRALTSTSAAPRRAPRRCGELDSSRLSALLTIAVCPIVGLDARGRRIWRRDRRRHAEPPRTRRRPSQHARARSGLRLAGPAVYFGKLVEKPTIGDASREIEWGDIARATGSCSPRVRMRARRLRRARAAVVLAVGAMA